MIESIEIKEFKCIHHELLKFAPLTILAGPNSSGKSTVLQAILLGACVHAQKNIAYLKEVVKPFSQFSEVYNRYYNAQAVEIVVTGRGWKVSLHKTLNADVPAESHSAQVKGLAYESSLYYLCANRIGPEELAELNRELKVGQSGQYALGYFEQQKDKPIHDLLVQDEAPARTLKGQIAWWLSFLTGYEIGPVVEKVTPLQVKVSFSTHDLEDISPFNTGAGTSYLLKLLIMCLCAEPGDVLLVENPEIHLHPGAQSRLGCLFTFLASRGVQLVVETHCEHLINRIRHEVYKKNLRENDSVVYYKPDAQNSFVHININSRGHYTDESGKEINFPQGFFDSTLAQLLEIN